MFRNFTGAYDGRYLVKGISNIASVSTELITEWDY